MKLLLFWRIYSNFLLLGLLGLLLSTLILSLPNGTIQINTNLYHELIPEIIGTCLLIFGVSFGVIKEVKIL